MNSETFAKCLAAAAASVVFTASPANAATLITGTQIGVDFGPTQPTNNMNMVGTVATGSWSPGSLLPGAIIDMYGVTIEGVGFSWTSTGQEIRFQNNDSVSSNSVGLSFNDSNMTDWFGVSDGSNYSTNTLVLTFSGLNNSMTYELVIGARFTGSGDIADTLWTVDGQSLLSDTDSSNDYRHFTGLSTDGSGNLVITGTGAGSRPDIAVVSSLLLTAVPEPGSFILLGAAGAFGLLRRRR